MELDAIWESLLSSMRTRISAMDVEVWLGNARLTGHVRSAGDTPDRLQIEVANRYYADWIGENYRPQMIAYAIEILGRPVEFEFRFPEESTREQRTFTTTTTPSPSDAPRSSGLITRQTFDSFVVGECNRFAHAAASAVADQPAVNYNPLFIYGATGLGKTHLMHAIGNRVLAEHPSSRIL